MIDWLLTPLSGATTHHLPDWTIWHARLMVLAWGVMLPLGVMLARFFKVWPGQDWPRHLDSKRWWHSHLFLQWAGVLIMSLGALLSWGQGRQDSPLALAHTLLGGCLIGLGWLQVVSGLLRGSKGGPTDRSLRGDHYDMTPRRIVFERWHKGLGWAAIVLSIVCISAGLVLADAPRWMALTLTLWWLALGAAFVWLQRAGYCLDTYQAIWGPDLDHPGLHRPPIGLGVRRRSAPPPT